MYLFWNNIIKPLILSLSPKVIVEVGADTGINTKNLLNFAKEHKVVVHSIDPFPKFDWELWLKEYQGHFVFHKELSLPAECWGAGHHPSRRPRH